MLSKCCCCVPLRTGSLVIAILGILGGLGLLAFSKGLTGLIRWPNIVEGIFVLLAYSFLLFGALKYNDKAVLVYVVLTALSIIIGIGFGIIAITNIEIVVPALANDCKALHSFVDCDNLRFRIIVTRAVKLFGVSLVNIYFWLCNYSFYKELKEGGGEAAV